MWGLDDLIAHRAIIDQIDWEMTPEKAIETYLEWGTGWARKNDFVRSPGQESFYWVVYSWEQPLQATLIRRSSQEMEEIARVPAPLELLEQTIVEGGRKPGVGVYAINEPLKDWLKNTLGC
jgi:hypothetical protein